MAELKTKPQELGVDEFIASLPDEARRADCDRVIALMREVTGNEPVYWGSNLIGFGQYHYRYESGHEGDSFEVGFAPRKDRLTFYLTGMDDQPELMARLGKHERGGSCLHLKKLDAIDWDVLAELIRHTVSVRRGG